VNHEDKYRSFEQKFGERQTVFQAYFFN
jgi:hypothetical protein